MSATAVINDNETSASNTAAQLQRVAGLFRRDMVKADRFFLALLWLHLPFAVFVFPQGFGTWKLGLIGGGATVLIATVSYFLFKGTLTLRFINANLLAAFSATFIVSQLGRIEMHFHVFGSIAFLVLYKDWRPLIAPAPLVLFYHAGLNYCQVNNLEVLGFPVMIFNYGYGLDIVILHAGFVVFETAILIYVALLFKKQFIDQNMAIEQLTEAESKLRDYSENLEEMVEQRTAEVVAAKKETDEIMLHVDEGLFLLLKDGDKYVLGEQHSATLEDMLGERNLGRRELLTVIGESLDDRTRESIIKYFKLLFRTDMNDDTLAELNPLAEFQLKGAADSRYLDFNFQRIMEGSAVKHILATVNDVTKEVKLSHQLKAMEDRNRSQMEVLLKLLHVDPAMLGDFMEGTYQELEIIDACLKSGGTDMRLNAQNISRAVHTIKGNASLLDLEFIANPAHEMEEILVGIAKSSEPRGEDFVPAVMRYNELYNTIEETNSLVRKLLQFQDAFGGSRSNANRVIIRALSRIVEKLNGELGKKTNLDIENFDLDPLPAKQRIMVKDILVQLLRNSMSHGIETPEERRADAKAEEGKIAIKTDLNDNRFELILEDDGRGIQVNRLKELAINNGLVNEQDIESWDNRRAAGLVFATGLSTAEAVTKLAGRGVGMDLVKRKVREADGKITLSFAEKKYTRFKISFPIYN